MTPTNTIRLKYMPRRRSASFYLLTRENPNSQTGILAFGRITGEEHLKICNRDNKTDPLTQSTQIVFGLIPVLPLSGKDYTYSPEGGDFEIDCSQTPNRTDIGENHCPTYVSDMSDKLAEMDLTCLFVKTETQSYLFIHPLDSDENFVTTFLSERLDGKILVSVLSSGTLKVKTPLTSSVSRILSA